MEIVFLLPWWALLIVSIVPYSIKQRRTQHMQSLVLLALVWHFELQWRRGSCAWSFSLPLVEQIQKSQQLLKIFRSAWIQSVLALLKKIGG